MNAKEKAAELRKEYEAIRAEGKEYVDALFYGLGGLAEIIAKHRVKLQALLGNATGEAQELAVELAIQLAGLPAYVSWPLRLLLKYAAPKLLEKLK